MNCSPVVESKRSKSRWMNIDVNKLQKGPPSFEWFETLFPKMNENNNNNNNNNNIEIWIKIMKWMFYGTSTSLIHSLQRVQNKLAKLVLLNPTFNSTDCLKKLHWLPIHNRIIFKIALMTYRTLMTSNPPYLQHLLFHRHTSGLRSSSTIQLHQPVHKSSLINRGFSHASPAVWNALPPQVRDQPSLELFKSHLKTHLFRTPTWS